MVKGTNNKELAKHAFSVCTQSLIMYVLHAKIKNRKHLFILKIRSLEVNEISDHVVL